MLDPRQDRALENLARSIARSVDVLGRTCTARLLGSIVLGLVDSPDSGAPTRPKSPGEQGTRTASSESGRHRWRRQVSHTIRTDPRRRRNRP